MKYIGQGIAFAGLAIAAAMLEIHDKNAAGLWLVIVLWWVFADWRPKEKDSDPTP